MAKTDQARLQTILTREAERRFLYGPSQGGRVWVGVLAIFKVRPGSGGNGRGSRGEPKPEGPFYGYCRWGLPRSGPKVLHGWPKPRGINGSWPTLGSNLSGFCDGALSWASTAQDLFLSAFVTSMSQQPAIGDILNLSFMLCSNGVGVIGHQEVVSNGSQLGEDHWKPTSTLAISESSSTSKRRWQLGVILGVKESR